MTGPDESLRSEKQPFLASAVIVLIYLSVWETQ
jgi:hypothetical protein